MRIINILKNIFTKNRNTEEVSTVIYDERGWPKLTEEGLKNFPMPEVRLPKVEG